MYLEKLSLEVENYLISFLGCKKYHFLYLVSKKYKDFFICNGDSLTPFKLPDPLDLFFYNSNYRYIKNKLCIGKICYCFVHDDPELKEIFMKYRNMIFSGSNTVHFSSKIVREKAKSIENHFGTILKYCCDGKGIIYETY